jgi:hypothetical protein
MKYIVRARSDSRIPKNARVVNVRFVFPPSGGSDDKVAFKVEISAVEVSEALKELDREEGTGRVILHV